MLLLLIAVQGAVGIAPGAPIFPLKVLSSNQLGYMSTVIAAVHWLLTDGIKLGIRVVNISLAAYVAPGSKVRWPLPVCSLL